MSWRNTVNAWPISPRSRGLLHLHQHRHPQRRFTLQEVDMTQPLLLRGVVMEVVVAERRVHGVDMARVAPQLPGLPPPQHRSTHPEVGLIAVQRDP